MARRTSRTTSRSGRRSVGGRGGYSGRKSSRASTRYAAPRKPARRGRSRSASRAPQTVRIVLEHAGAAPVREGQQVDIGMKVESTPHEASLLNPLGSLLP